MTIVVAPGVSQIENLDPSGWGNSMTFVQLPDGVLIHSPTWLGEGTYEKVAAVGEPRVLLAPNHFHHLSLARFRERYPKAVVIAGDQARIGLKARKHEGIRELSAAREHLGDGVEMLEPPGTRAGEIFLSLPGDGGRTWVVCDAFFGVNRDVTGPVGWFLKLTKATPGLRIGNTYRWLGLSDRRMYLGWLLAKLAEERPTTLVMSHGETVRDPDLWQRLVELAKRRLP